MARCPIGAGTHAVCGRLDGVIAGSAQLVRPTKNNEAQSHAASLTTNFVAPWARGYGIGHGIIQAVERRARTDGFSVLNLDVRSTQVAAIGRYDALGFIRWAENPYYARVDGAVSYTHLTLPTIYSV